MMSLLMVLAARAYAPLAARGALVDGLQLGNAAGTAARPRSPDTVSAPFRRAARRSTHVLPAAAVSRGDRACDSLASPAA